MALILDPDAIPIEQLRTMLSEHRQALEGLRAAFAEVPPLEQKGPTNFLGINELLEDSIVLLRKYEASESDAASVAAAVNLGYSVMISAIDLKKSHTDGPKVPQGSGHEPAAEV